MKKSVLAAIVGPVLAFGASRAHAAPIISGTYYEETANRSCTGASSCSIYFSATPSSQFFTVNNASCAMQTGGSPITFPYMGIAATNGGELLVRYVIFQPIITSASNTQITEAFNNQINFKIGSGRFPVITTQTVANTTINVTCTIIGTLSNQ